MIFDQAKAIDDWLDNGVSAIYEHQPLAQDWARISKVAEELGEAIGEFILWTGQNPRKPKEKEAYDRFLEELADVVCTGILCIQHFTKNDEITSMLIEQKMFRIWDRMQKLGGSTLYPT